MQPLDGNHGSGDNAFVKPKLIIRSASAAGHPNIRTWQPADPTNFAEFVTLAIGFSSKQGTDDFSIRVATPTGLAELPSNDGIIATRPLLIVSRYEYSELWQWLEATVTMCSSGTWPECVERLRRYFNWEYDDYKEV